MTAKAFAVGRRLADPAARAPVAGRPGHPLLDLQRSAGNGAVAALLRQAPADRERAPSRPVEERRDVTDPDARHRSPPPDLAWSGARFGRGTVVVVHETAEKSGKRYHLVTQELGPGVMGPPLHGWTLATNLAPRSAGPSPEPAPAEAPTTGAPTTGAPGVPAAGRAGGDLQQLISALGHPVAQRIGQDLAAIQQLSGELLSQEAGHSRTEEVGARRDQLVSAIAALRLALDGLGAAGLDEASARQLTALVNRALNDISPFYAQSTNMDLLEGKAQAEELGTETAYSTRTCNITSVSMALEALGKSPADHDPGRREAVALVAEVFAPEVRSAEHTAGGAGAGLERLRMPDYVQLAAIAHVLGSGTGRAAVLAAARSAWQKILSIHFLEDLAESFGAGGELVTFDLDPSAKGTDFAALDRAGKHRSAVERLVDLRNQVEAATGKRRTRLERAYQQRYRAMRDELAVGTDAVSVDAYRRYVIEHIGTELDAGSQIVVYLHGHYVRLQAVHDDHVVVDDPGRAARANRKVTYEEARAMAYFKMRLVISA